MNRSASWVILVAALSVLLYAGSSAAASVEGAPLAQATPTPTPTMLPADARQRVQGDEPIDYLASGLPDGTFLRGSSGYVWNGTAWERMRGGAVDPGAAAGILQVQAMSPSGTRQDALAGTTDGNSGGRALLGHNLLWNGSSADRAYGNVNTAALITASGATTTQTSADQTNYNGRCVKVVLDMTTVGTGSVTLTIQGKDAASGKYYTLLAGAAVVTNVTNVYSVCPGITATANVSASDVLPRTWRVVATANNVNPTTYTVGASVIN